MHKGHKCAHARGVRDIVWDRSGLQTTNCFSRIEMDCGVGRWDLIDVINVVGEKILVGSKIR